MPKSSKKVDSKNIKVTITVLDGALLMLETQTPSIIDHFDSLHISKGRQNVIIYQTNIKEKSYGYLILDLNEFVNQFTLGDYQLTVFYFNEKKELKELVLQQIINFFDNAEKKARKKEIINSDNLEADVLKIPVLPYDLSMWQNEYGDILIYSSDLNYLNAIETVYFSNQYLQGWVSIQQNDQIIRKGKEIVIPRYIFVASAALPRGTYDVNIEAGDYDDFFSIAGIKFQYGAKLLTDEVHFYQDSQGALCISCLDIEWLKKIFAISFYYENGDLADLGIDSFIDYYTDNLIVINYSNFSRIFEYLTTGIFFIHIKSSGYVPYQSSFPNSITTSYTGQPFTKIDVKQSENGNLSIICDDQTWLNYVYGISFLDEKGHEKGLIDWRSNFSGIVLEKNKIVILYARLFEDFQFIEDIYSYQLLNYQSERNFIAKSPFEVVRFSYPIDFRVDIIQDVDGDLIIASSDDNWLNELTTIYLKNDGHDYSIFITQEVKENYFNVTYRIPLNFLMKKYQFESGYYNVEAHSTGYDAYYSLGDINIEKGASETILGDDLKIYQDNKDNLIIESFDYEWLNNLQKMYLESADKPLKIVDLIRFTEGVDFKDNQYVILFDRLVQDGVTGGEYWFVFDSKGYQQVRYFESLIVNKTLMETPKDLSVFQGQDGELQIITVNEKWLNRLAEIQIVSQERIFQETKNINLIAESNGVYITNKVMYVPYWLLQNTLGNAKPDYLTIKLVATNGEIVHQSTVFIDVILRIKPTPIDLLVSLNFQEDLIVYSSDIDYLMAVHEIRFSSANWFVATNDLSFAKIQKIEFFENSLIIRNYDLINCGIGFGEVIANVFAKGYVNGLFEFKSNFSASVSPIDVSIEHLDSGDMCITSSNQNWLQNIRELNFESLNKFEDFCIGKIDFNNQDGIEVSKTDITINEFLLTEVISFQPGKENCVIKASGYLNAQYSFEFKELASKHFHIVNGWQNGEGDLILKSPNGVWINKLSEVTFQRAFSRNRFTRSIAVNKNRFGITFLETQIIIKRDVFLADGEFESGYYRMSLRIDQEPLYNSPNIVEISKGVDNVGYLTCIYIENYPKHLVCREGQKPNLVGLSVFAQFSDGKIQQIYDYVALEFDSSPGLRNVILRYHDKEVTFKIEVIKRSVVKISIFALPNKIVYLEGETFSANGLLINAHYDNDTIESVNDYELSGYDTTPGLKRLRVTYKDKIAEFNVKVVNRKTKDIQIIKLPFKSEYIEGEIFEQDGLEVVVHYNNNTSETINEYMIFGYDITPGLKKITVLYDGKQAHFDVTVVASILISIKAEAFIKPIEFREGEIFDRSKIKVVAFFSNNTTKEVEEFEYSGYDSTPGIKSVQVTYGGKQDVVNVKVLSKRLERISIINPPFKIEYIQGEEFDSSGMEVLASYDNGVKELISNYQIIGGISSPGTQKIKIKYENKIDILAIEVKKKELSHILVTTKPTKYRYLEGEKFDISGITTTAFYNDGTFVEIERFEYSGYDAQPGIKNITINYQALFDSFEVEVIGRELIHIQIIRKPFKTEFDEGDEFTNSGLEVKAYYNNNSEEYIKAFNITGYESTPGLKHIIVEHNGKYDSYEVEVKPRKITHLKIANLPEKLKYIEGEQIDLSGIEVIAHYHNNLRDVIYDYEIEGFVSTPGTKRITVCYENQCDSFNVDVIHRKLVNIRANINPDYSHYIEGDLLDRNAIKVIAFYNNGSEEVINHFLVSGYDASPGSKIINITYGGKTDSVMLEVLPKQIAAIKISSKPFITVYLEGDLFNSDGLIVSAIYTNGTFKDITDYEVLGYDSSPGVKNIQVQYDGFSDSFVVRVTSRKLEKIEVSSKPNKLIYLEGDLFDSYGMNVTSYYNNGSNENISNYIISGYDLTIGIKKITVTYKGKHSSFNVEVVPCKLISISVVKLPTKIHYLEGDLLNTEGLVVRGFYNNNTQHVVSDYEIYGYENTPGTKAIQVVYQSFTDVFNVEVEQRAVVGISIVKKPEKLLYLEGETINLEGMIVQAYFNNNTKEVVKNYIVSGYDGSPGTKRISVLFEDKTDVFNVRVSTKKIVRIQVAVKPNKMVYLENEDFEPTGISVVAFYDNDSFDNIDNFEISGYDATPGKKKITASYLNQIDIFYVEVISRQLSYISITKKPKKIEYLEGESFNANGLEVTAFYNNHCSEIIADYTVDGYVATPGRRNIVVGYKDQIETLNINILSKEISSIKVSHKPEKIVYLEGDEFDKTGMVVTAYYNNGTNDTILDYLIDGFDSSPGNKRIVISKKGSSDTFVIKIQEKKLNQIIISKHPNKVIYLEDEKLNIDGLVVVAQYNNSTQERINKFTVSGYNSKPGIKNVSVLFSNKVATFAVEVLHKKIIQVVASKKIANLEYLEGDVFKSEDVNVLAFYDNNSSEEINYHNYNIEGYDSTPGIKMLRFIVDGISDTLPINVRSKSLIGLVVSNKPNKVNYIEDESFNTSGMVVKAIYDNTTETIISDYQITGYDSGIGIKHITVSYEKRTDGFTVDVVPKTLISITCDQVKKDLVYLEDDKFDNNAIVVNAHYTNGNIIKVNNYSMSGFDGKPGTKKILIIYENKSTSIIVKIKAKKLLRIDIVKSPIKTDYLEGESFTSLGMVVVANYDNNTQEQISNYQVIGYRGTPGRRNITVEFGGKKDVLEVNVLAKKLTRIEIVRKPDKLIYLEGDKFEQKGLIVNAYFNNNTLEEIHRYNVNGFKSTPGQYRVDVEYNGMTDSFELVTQAKQLLGITVVSKVNPLAFFEGEEFDNKRIQVTAFYNNNSQTRLGDYKVSGYDSKPGAKNVIINYNGIKEIIKCLVVPRKAIGISVSCLPDRVIFMENESFDRQGLEVSLFNNDGSKEVVSPTEVSGYDSSPGEKKILITYKRRVDIQGNTAIAKTSGVIDEILKDSFIVEVLPKTKRIK